jgi:hypothetical protein
VNAQQPFDFLLWRRLCRAIGPAPVFPSCVFMVLWQQPIRAGSTPAFIFQLLPYFRLAFAFCSSVPMGGCCFELGGVCMYRVELVFLCVFLDSKNQEVIQEMEFFYSKMWGL